MKTIGVIPCRYQSSRFPGKPLALINYKPMMWHNYQRALESNRLLNKKHILRKQPLRDIKDNLITNGCIQFKYHYNLLNLYLKQEKNLDFARKLQDHRKSCRLY